MNHCEKRSPEYQFVPGCLAIVHRSTDLYDITTAMWSKFIMTDSIVVVCSFVRIKQFANIKNIICDAIDENGFDTIVVLYQQELFMMNLKYVCEHMKVIT